jgi:hypothetical protein
MGTVTSLVATCVALAKTPKTVLLLIARAKWRSEDGRANLDWASTALALDRSGLSATIQLSH